MKLSKQKLGVILTAFGLCVLLIYLLALYQPFILKLLLYLIIACVIYYFLVKDKSEDMREGYIIGIMFGLLYLISADEIISYVANFLGQWVIFLVIPSIIIGVLIILYPKKHQT